MTNKPINFKQELDFGDLFNATFSFITQEFKLLITAIIYFVSPLLLLSAIAMTVYSTKSQEITHSLTQTAQNDPFAAFSVMGTLFGYLGVMMLLTIAASAMMMGTVFGYIKLYIQNGSGGFSIIDIWRMAMKYFWQILWASIIVTLVVIVGFVFCIIPGIYLGVALSIIFCIMVFEEKSFSEAFGRSIKLINTNWWFTFGVVLIATIAFYILTFLLSIPSIILGFKSMFMNLKDMKNIEFSTDFYIVNIITQLISNIALVIPIVITAFLYYSFVEKVEKPSLIEKIDQIGENE